MSAWGWIWRVGGVLVLLLDPGRRRTAVLCFDAALCQHRPAEGDHRPRRCHRRPGGAAVFAMEPAPSLGRGGWPDHSWPGGRGVKCPMPISTGFMRGPRSSPSSMPSWVSTFSRSTARRSISSFTPMARTNQPTPKAKQSASGSAIQDDLRSPGPPGGSSQRRGADQ